jgi:glycosyltransferase involved in cell wall biosynthesis
VTEAAPQYRVLFLAQRTTLPDHGVPPHGSGAHVAASLSALRGQFEVAALGPAPGSESASGAPNLLRSMTPAVVRGLRRDTALLRADRRFTRQALDVAGAFQPDVVYERSEYLAQAGLKVAEQLGVPLILEVNGLLDRDAQTMYRSPLEPLGSSIERRKLLAADAVVTVSHGLAGLLVDRGADPRLVVVAPNTVEPRRVVSQPRPSRHGQVVIGWLGHLMDWHADALLFFIDVVSTVDRNDVRYRIIGGGPRLAEVEQHAKTLGVADRFDFVGTVAYEEVPGALETIDIAVIPDVFDYAFPVKLVEYGAAGLPVIAPRSASLDSQLKPFIEYRPFERGNGRALHDALIALIDDVELRARLGSELHNAVRDRFTWMATAETLRQVVTRVVAART